MTRGRGQRAPRQTVDVTHQFGDDEIDVRTWVRRYVQAILEAEGLTAQFPDSQEAA